MFIDINAPLSLAPVGAECKVADHIPLRQELGDAYSLACYKYAAPTGASACLSLTLN